MKDLFQETAALLISAIKEKSRHYCISVLKVMKLQAQRTSQLLSQGDQLIGSVPQLRLKALGSTAIIMGRRVAHQHVHDLFVLLLDIIKM